MFRIEEAGQFRGPVTFINAKLNAGCVKKTHIEAEAGIEVTKLVHQHRAVWAKESDTTAVAEDYVIHIVKGTTGTLQTFAAGCVVAPTGTATITLDLHKNGVTVLTETFNVDSGDAAYAVVAGTIDTAAVAADDVLEVIITVAAGDGAVGKGLFVYLDIHEEAD